MKIRTKVIMTIGILTVSSGVIFLIWINYAFKGVTISTEVSQINDKTIFVGGTKEDHKNFTNAYPHIHQAWEHLREGQRYTDQGNYERAIQEVKKAIELDPNSETEFVARICLAEVYEKTGVFDLALEQLEIIDPRWKNQQRRHELIEWKERLRAQIKESKK